MWQSLNRCDFQMLAAFIVTLDYILLESVRQHSKKTLDWTARMLADGAYDSHDRGSAADREVNTLAVLCDDRHY